MREENRRGQAIDMNGWYAKTRPTFEVAGERGAFLNSRVFVGNLLPGGPTSVPIDIHELL